MTTKLYHLIKQHKGKCLVLGTLCLSNRTTQSGSSANEKSSFPPQSYLLGQHSYVSQLKELFYRLAVSKSFSNHLIPEEKKTHILIDLRLNTDYLDPVQTMAPQAADICKLSFL